MNKYVHRFFAPMRVLILLTLASTFLAAPHAIAQLTWKPSPALPSGTSGTYAWVEGNEVNLQVPKVYDEGTNVTLTYRLEIKVAQGYTNVDFFSVDTSNADYNVITGTVPANSAGNWAEFYYIAKGTSGSVTHEKQALVDFVCYDEPAFTETSIQDESYTSGQAITAKTLPPVHTFVAPGPGYVGLHRKISYSLSPTLPQGLTFDASTRQITGTPAGAVVQTEYTYTVTDGSDTVSENHLERSIEGQGQVTKTLTFNITVVSPADAMPVLSSEEQLQLGELLTFDTLIINEFHNASDNTNDYLELRNVSAADLSLNDWQLSILTSHGNVAVGFPAGTIIPAGEILLLVNTPLADTAMSSVVVQTFAIPQGEFALILQGPSMIGDLAGNSLGDETTRTLAVDTVWHRSQPIIPGYLAEAWTENTQATPTEAADLNNDGVVNILDLVLVASQFGTTDTIADLNADGAVNIQDLVLVANALNDVAAAPTAQQSQAAVVNNWLQLARQNTSGVSATSIPEGFSYARGIQVLEQLAQVFVPETTALLANYPNPFNPETWIPYQLAKGSDVTVSIYAADGSIVRTLALGHQDAGMYHNRTQAAYWDGTNAFGETVASGLYFYTLTAGDFTATRRMLILK